MKTWIRLIPIITVLGFLGYVWAQTGPHGYTCYTVSVTSNAVPVSIISPSGNITTWYMENSVTPGTDPVLVFPYNKTLPGAAPNPEAEMEIPSGTSFFDSVNCDTAACREAIGQGWAAVLESGSTATKVRACIR